jgi:hypothetical protein
VVVVVGFGLAFFVGLFDMGNQVSGGGVGEIYRSH